ncbi:MAG: NUDIX domain-containing protein [Clostridiaceae bacterium]|nr:NUDIX domain-containing protein [Clostridiaceae bacterium]
MEIWDLYDANRQPLGRTIVRGESLADGEYYICGEIWVMNSAGQFLITKRHPDKKAGNLWEFVGGGTLAGETTRASAKRELHEETGIPVDEEELKLLVTYARDQYFLDIYVVKKDIPISNIRLQPGEAIDAKWATPDEVQGLIRSGEFVSSVGKRFLMYKDKIEL